MQEKASGKRKGLTERLKEKDASIGIQRAKRICLELLWGGIAYLIGLGGMLFDTKPWGVALICGMHGHLGGVLGGLILSEVMLMDRPVLMICTYVAATVIRVASTLVLSTPEAVIKLPRRAKKRSDGDGEAVEYVSAERSRFGEWIYENYLSVKRFVRDVGGLFTESICLRMSTAAVSMLVVSLFRIISGGFRYYDLFAAIFAVIVAPAATLVFSVRLEDRQENRVLRAISSAALLYAIVWSANNAAIASVPVSAVLALFLTLLATEQEGVLWGVFAGVICGIAYAPMEVPAFLLAALIYGGVKWKHPEILGVQMAAIGAFLWSFYAGGIASLAVSVPAYLLAGAAFTVAYRLLRRDKAREAEIASDAQAELRHARTRHEDANDRFRNISEAFSSLSEMFYNLSDRLRRPGTLDLRRICDSSFDCFCTDCPNKTVCWGLEYSDTLGVMNGLISRLHTKGRVSREQIPSHLLQRCPSMDRILMQINTECARFTGELLRNNRNEIFAMDYEAAANIINDALAEDDGEYKFDTELEMRLQEYLSYAGITAQSVSVYGNRRRQILVRGVNIERSTVTMETLRSDFGEMCGLELSLPSFEVEGNVTSMMLGAKRKLAVQGAQMNFSADGGVSGDSINLFSNQKDYYYALISDGMGAGREAAFTSNLCSTFLEKMLRAGNRANTSLRMLNNLILSRCSDSTEECSSTIDLIELDLITGRASFIKGGAAPSFVIRGGALHRLQAGTAPIGIIRKLDTKTAKFDLRVGDTVVMISDGIMENDPDCKWLSAYLAECEDKTPEEIANDICQHAAQSEKHDDCSAVALRIEAAEEIVEE